MDDIEYFSKDHFVAYCCNCGCQRHHYGDSRRCSFCGSLYESYVREDGVTALGIGIEECGIEYDPELIICKHCHRLEDCSIHHVLIGGKK